MTKKLILLHYFLNEASSLIRSLIPEILEIFFPNINIGNYYVQ